MNSKTKLSLNPRVRFRSLGDEGVIVQIDTGRIIVVNQVGVRILECLSEQVEAGYLVATITEEFDVTAEQAEVDIVDFLNSLGEEAVVEEAPQ